jgi:hypothetical protein
MSSCLLHGPTPFFNIGRKTLLSSILLQHITTAAPGTLAVLSKTHPPCSIFPLPQDNVLAFLVHDCLFRNKGLVSLSTINATQFHGQSAPHPFSPYQIIFSLSSILFNILHWFSFICLCKAEKSASFS